MVDLANAISYKKSFKKNTEESEIKIQRKGLTRR